MMLPALVFDSSFDRTGASQIVQQTNPAAQKKSIEEEAAEIEKDFGVRVVREGDQLYCEIESPEYRNYQYDFRISLPQGLRGLTTVPPHPQHGFYVRLAGKPGGRITVQAEFNAALFDSLDEVVEVEMKTANWQSPDYELRKKRPTKLRDIPAVQMIAHFTDQLTGERYVSQQLIALRRESEDDFGIIYILRLDTPKSNFKEDSKVLKEMIRSWRKFSETAEPGTVN